MAPETVNRRVLLLSLGYWFSSRTLGLLEHPYITMRVIARDRFMRPLVLVPIVVWGASWFLGMVLTRLGVWLSLGRFAVTDHIARGLLFVWVWGTVFVVVWQGLLFYLWWRFRVLPRE